MINENTKLVAVTVNNAPVYEAICAVMGDIKAQLEKRGKTQFGGKAVTADDMMIEVRQAMAKHCLYLEQTELESERTEQKKKTTHPNGVVIEEDTGSKFYVKYQFTWIWKGVRSEPEIATIVGPLNKSTDSGAIRTYGWKYYVRDALMIATGEEDLDAYGTFDNGGLQREATAQNQLVGRFNSVQTYLVELGFHKDCEAVMHWIVNVGELELDPRSEQGLVVLEHWCNDTAPLIEKYGKDRVVQSVRGAITNLMGVTLWLEKSNLD